MVEAIKWAIFDIDDTLYDYKHSNKEWTEAVLDFAEKKLNENALNQEKKDEEIAKEKDIKNLTNTLDSFDEPKEVLPKEKKFSRDEIKSAISWGRKETNEAMPTQWSWHSRLLYFQKAIETLTWRTNFELTLEMEEVFWDAFVEHMEVYDGAIETLKKMKEKNIKVTILTDLTAQIQHKKIIKLLGWNNHYVDYLVSSEEVGVEKPDPRWFALSMKKMGIENKDEVCMIGDNYEKDIKWAKDFGITKLYHKVNEEKEGGEEYKNDGVNHFKFFSEIQWDF